MASSEHSSSDDHYFCCSQGKPNRKELRTHFSEDEEDLIVRMYKLLGNRWSLIAGRIPGRTAEEIEKYCMAEKIATKKQKEPVMVHSQSKTEIQKPPI